MNAVLNIKSFDCITCTWKIQYTLEEEGGIYFAKVLVKVGKVRLKYDPGCIQPFDSWKKTETIGCPVQYVTQVKSAE